MSEHNSLALHVLLDNVKVLHFNAGSCNGCDMEVVVALSSLREAKGFGGKSIAGLKHVLVMVVTGSVTRKVANVLKRIYEQVKDPKYVVAVGTCAVSGGVFRRSYNVVGGVDRVIPVDLYIPGCPPHPKAIVEGIRRLVEKAGEKS